MIINLIVLDIIYILFFLGRNWLSLYLVRILVVASMNLLETRLITITINDTSIWKYISFYVPILPINLQNLLIYRFLLLNIQVTIIRALLFQRSSIRSLITTILYWLMIQIYLLRRNINVLLLNVNHFIIIHSWLLAIFIMSNWLWLIQLALG